MGEEMEANICYLGIELNDSYAKLYATEYGRTGDGQHDCRQ